MLKWFVTSVKGYKQIIYLKKKSLITIESSDTRYELKNDLLYTIQLIEYSGRFAEIILLTYINLLFMKFSGFI